MRGGWIPKPDLEIPARAEQHHNVDEDAACPSAIERQVESLGGCEPTEPAKGDPLFAIQERLESESQP